MHVVRDNEVVRPIDDLLIRLVRGLRTEGRVPNETLKHDRAQGPPIALVPISFLQENLGGDVIRRSDGRICLHTQRVGNKNKVQMKIGREEGVAYEFPAIRFPGRDLILARHGQMDGVHHDAVPRRLRGSRRRRDTARGIQKTLIVA